MGGTAEAPNNLPLGVQPLGDCNTKSSPDTLPGGSQSWSNFQESQSPWAVKGTGYGDVSVGSPAQGILGQEPSHGGWQNFQASQVDGQNSGTGYGGVSIASPHVNPTIGPDGT